MGYIKKLVPLQEEQVSFETDTDKHRTFTEVRRGCRNSNKRTPWKVKKQAYTAPPKSVTEDTYSKHTVPSRVRHLFRDINKMTILWRLKQCNPKEQQDIGRIWGKSIDDKNECLVQLIWEWSRAHMKARCAYKKTMYNEALYEHTNFMTWEEAKQLVRNRTRASKICIASVPNGAAASETYCGIGR